MEYTGTIYIHLYLYIFIYIYIYLYTCKYKCMMFYRVVRQPYWLYCKFDVCNKLNQLNGFNPIRNRFLFRFFWIECFGLSVLDRVFWIGRRWDVPYDSLEIHLDRWWRVECLKTSMESQIDDSHDWRNPGITAKNLQVSRRHLPSNSRISK